MGANEQVQPSLLGLSPLFVFLVTYLGCSLLLNDFYAMPLSVAFVIASCYALVVTRGLSLEKRVEQFTIGASNHNILTMVWIFILAGAFASGAKFIGAIDASVHVIMSVLPSNTLLPSLFLSSCLVSLSVGTSVGTIVALSPIAMGFAQQLGVSPEYIISIVVGGAFFGDNLSFISDTTIAATRTQGVSMKDKFRVNFLIVLPAALVTFIIYVVQGIDLPATVQINEPKVWLIIPYIVVIVTALMGINVLVVLMIGIVSCGIIGAINHVDVWAWMSSLGSGIKDMGELIIVTLLAGGLLELIRYNGGIAYIIRLLSRHIRGKRGGEFSIALLVMLANICTANNTIAILTTSDMASSISKRYDIDRRRTASILDTFSCVVQGLLPYGAQLLLAAGFASVSPLNFMPYLYYPILLGLCATFAILMRYPRRFAK